MKLHTTLRRTLVASAIVATALGGQTLTVSASAVDSTKTCASVITIVARGTNEAAGTGGTTNVYSSSGLYSTRGLGRMSTVSAKVALGTTKTVRTVGLKYPASKSYISSLNTGRSRLANELNRLATNCPSSRTVLIGYSQGAHVIGDVTSNSNPNGLTTAAKSRIAAVYLTGDPVRRNGQTHNRGTAGGNGIFGARAAGQMSGLGSRIISYCYKGDTICDHTQRDWVKGDAIHGSYNNDSLNAEWSKFILGKL